MTEPSSRRSGYARLLDRAIRILAMRDHSEQELRRKLVAPGDEQKPVLRRWTPPPTSWSRFVAWCIENRYLDDNRFVGQFIASRSRKGYGPARIRQELSQKGIARQVVDQAMRKCDIDWVSLAREQAQRKYGEPLPSAFTEKVKVQRFLLYRGYLMEDIQEIWRNFAD
ncbi:Regulatory protein RecX [Klebsiella pneumoniae]|uniref:Regulatory protein RecX n=1 Tax=Klebsiella pneumoniae TaxID=573 RepID=A0A4P0YDU3_KLEPN|nr:Regulatory protein RecX [Klebsiella pneumoniae]